VLSAFEDRHGYQEESEGDNIIFVRSGVFGRVIGKRIEIADSASIMFFKKDYSYRFRPVSLLSPDEALQPAWPDVGPSMDYDVRPQMALAASNRFQH
jgi:hypothetical protein